MGCSESVRNIAAVSVPRVGVNHVRIHLNPRVAWIPANVHFIRRIVRAGCDSRRKVRRLSRRAYLETILYIYLLRNAGISRMRYGLGAQSAKFIHFLERVIAKTTSERAPLQDRYTSFRFYRPRRKRLSPPRVDSHRTDNAP